MTEFFTPNLGSTWVPRRGHRDPEIVFSFLLSFVRVRVRVCVFSYLFGGVCSDNTLDAGDFKVIQSRN